MAYKYTDFEKIEKKKIRATRTSGVFSVLIGALFLLGGIFFGAALKSLGGFILMFIFALIFIGAGVYFFNQPKIEKNKQAALDNPNSRAYRKRQEKIRKGQERYLKMAEKHPSLKTLMCFRAAAIFGFFSVLCFVFAFFSLAVGVIAITVAITGIICGIAFFQSIFGKSYRTIIKGYSEHGISKEDAELDFKTSKVYMKSTDIFSVSSRFFVAPEVPAVLAIEDIVWVFSTFDTVDQYSNGMYSHTDRKYGVAIGLENGMLIKIYCPEELCSILINDIVTAGNMITEGYSKELHSLFLSAPENFKSTAKNSANIIYTPVGPEYFKDNIQ